MYYYCRNDGSGSWMMLLLWFVLLPWLQFVSALMTSWVLVAVCIMAYYSLNKLVYCGFCLSPWCLYLHPWLNHHGWLVFCCRGSTR